MSAKKKAGIVLVILSIIGGLFSLLYGAAVGIMIDLLLLGVGIILFAQGGRPDSPEAEPEPELEGDLIRKMISDPDALEEPGGTPGARPETVGTVPEKRSKDEEYAAEHDSWICSKCETINPNASPSCMACGNPRF